MLYEQLFNNIECAIAHKCTKKEDNSNRCAQCEIGYRFIAFEPVALACGHYVCNECIQKLQQESNLCKFCIKNMANSEESELAIKYNMPNLFEVLIEKYVKVGSKFYPIQNKPPKWLNIFEI